MKLKDYYQKGTEIGVPPLATRAGNFIFYGGGIAAHPVTGVPGEVKPIQGYPYHWSFINRQLRYIYDNMAAILEESGSSIKSIMRVNTYHTNGLEIFESLRLRQDYFGVEDPPASTLVIVPELAVKGASVATDVIALASGEKREALSKSTQDAPMPPHERIYGHKIFSKATRGGGFLFAAGRTNTVIGWGAEQDKASGHPDFPYRNDRSVIAAEIILEYLSFLLKEMGASMEHVVKVEVHLRNMKDLAGLEEVWPRFFPVNPPARVLVPVIFPNDYAIFEIEFIAVDPNGPYRKKVISTPKAPQPTLNEPQAIKAGPYLFLSGQLATDYKQGVAPEAEVDPKFPFFSSGIKKQVRYILKNAEAICSAAGTSLNQIVRRRAMHFDLNEFGEAETVWRQALGDRLPPTTVFRTAGPLQIPGCSVGYDLIVFIPD